MNLRYFPYGTIASSFLTLSAIIYKSLSQIDYIEPYYLEGSWLSTCYDFTLHADFYSLEPVYINCFFAVVAGGLMGIDNISPKKQWAILLANIIGVKLIPTILRHGVFDLSTVLLMLVFSFLGFITMKAVKRIIVKFDLLEYL